MAKLGAVALLIAINALIIWVIRTYSRRGVVLAFPINIRRERHPRRFEATIIGLIVSEVLCALFSLFILFAILSD